MTGPTAFPTSRLRQRPLSKGDGLCLPVTDVVLAVEVLSPNSAGDDLILKRHQYGRAGIPHRWIVDQRQRTLTVLRHDGATA